MGDQETDIRQEIKKTERRLEILRDIDILEAEFRLIKTEYLQRRRELYLRLNDADDSCESPEIPVLAE